MAPVIVSAVALVGYAGSPALAATSGSGNVQSAGRASTSVDAVPVVASPPVTAEWNAPSTSVRAATSAVTGIVSPGQRIGIVRLANVGGHPVVSVARVIGPQAAAVAVVKAQQAPDTLSVSVDHRVTALGQPASNDTYRSYQWGLTRLAAEDTWMYSRGKGVVVAVIDTGVSVQPDLRGQLLTGTDLVNGFGNGTADGDGHGTHVAGIIAAVANNGLGVAGIAPSARILPVRVLDDSGRGWTSDIAAGILYATNHGARVINMSLGSSYNDDSVFKAVSFAQQHNVVVVAAAGNERDDGNLPSYPAAYPGVLAVAATDSADRTAYFSNTGSYVGIAAPGVTIASTYLRGEYWNMSGTSMASPFVAGAAALVRAAAPRLAASSVVADLKKTARDLAPAGRDNASGAGLVNPRAAVCAVSSCGATRLNLVPRTLKVTYGQPVILRGQLVDVASGRGLAAQPASWCYRVPGSANHCVTLRTDRNGWMQARYTPATRSFVHLTYAGNARSRASTSVSFTIAVRAAVTLRVGVKTLAMQVHPAVRQHYQLQRLMGTRWVTLTTDYTTSLGRARFPLQSGMVVRVVTLAMVGRAAGATGAVTIR